jgi:hypothetical protein
MLEFLIKPYKKLENNRGWKAVKCWKCFLDSGMVVPLFSVQNFVDKLAEGECGACPGRRHGSTRVPAHAFLAWHSSWQCFMYINSFSKRSAEDRDKWCGRQGMRNGPFITYKITRCWVTLLQSARRAAVLGQPSSLRPHWWCLHHARKGGEVELLDQTFPFCEECLHE